MGFFSDTLDSITGKGAAEAAERASALQVDAANQAIARQEQGSSEAQGFLQPFGQIGQQGLDQASFLTDPNQQFDFLQSNPLFQLALDNANQQTQQTAAAGGRLSAGDTLQQLSNNVLLSGSPLINQQANRISGLLDFGRGVATSQSNTAIGAGSSVAPLLQNIGNVQGAGVIGAQNARDQGVGNLINIGTTAAGLMGGFPGGGIATTGLTNLRPGG